MGRKVEKGELLPIGVVAKSFGVSENRIRRMESAGLFEPACRNESSGYRYYDSDNIAHISTILSLKAFGFTNEEILEHLNTPGDYTALYEKLLEKQDQLHKMSRRMSGKVKSRDVLKCELTTHKGAYYLCREHRLKPSLEEIASLTRAYVFDMVKRQLPVDYMNSVIILTECNDYRQFDGRAEQSLTFCIPLRRQVELDEVNFIPDIRAVSFSWSVTSGDIPSILPIVDAFFESRGMKQSGVLRAAYEIGQHQGKEISVDDTIMHILIPYSM